MAKSSNQKQLFILRHAQAAGAMNGDDFERILTPKGTNDAKALGEYLRKKQYAINTVLCSPALRTRETYAALDIHSAHEIFPNELYNAMAGDLFKSIQSVPDDVQTVLLVAHNPGVLELLSLLCDPSDEHQAAKLSDQLMMGYQPATLSVLNCDLNSWKELQPHENELIDLVSPIDYNASDRPTRWM
jgi:phosphohistidine phosphatase